MARETPVSGRLTVPKIPGNLGWEVLGETGIFPGHFAV